MKIKLPVVSLEARKALTVGVNQRHPVVNLEELGATQRMINMLEDSGIFLLKDLLTQKPEQLLEIPNFGEKQLIHLFSCLAEYHTLQNE
jgi:DNA-directed RNA polymerase alpha subunit